MNTKSFYANSRILLCGNVLRCLLGYVGLLVCVLQVNAACPCAFTWVRYTGIPATYALNASGQLYKSYGANSGADDVECDNGSGSNPMTFPMTIVKQSDSSVLITISAADAASCTTNRLVQYTNYILNICFTNRLATYTIITPTMTKGGVSTLIGDNRPIAPGAYVCFHIEEDGPFTFTFGDPVFATDVPPVTVSPTNIVQVIPGGGSDTATPNPPGPVTGNPNMANGSGGTGANGSASTNASQLDIRQMSDAQIQANAENLRRLIAQLEMNRTNGNGGGTAPDYSGYFQSLTNSSTRGANASSSLYDFTTNAAARAASTNTLMGTLAAGAGAAASNVMASSGLGSLLTSLNYGSSITGNAAAFATGLRGASLPVGYGLLTVTSGTASIVASIDVASVLDATALNATAGTSWRPWLRALLLWGMVTAFVIWFAQQIVEGAAKVSSASQVQVSDTAAGVLSLTPGATVGIRVVMVAILLAVVVALPTIILGTVSSAIVIVGLSSIGSALGSIGTLLTPPVFITNVFRSLDSWLPLWEGVIFAFNVAGGRLLISSCVAFLCWFKVAFGV